MAFAFLSNPRRSFMFKLISRHRRKPADALWGGPVNPKNIMSAILSDCKGASVEVNGEPKLLSFLSEHLTVAAASKSYPVFSVTNKLVSYNFAAEHLYVGIHWPSFIRKITNPQQVEAMPSMVHLLSALKDVFSCTNPLLAVLMPRYLASVTLTNPPVQPLNVREEMLLRFYVDELSRDPDFITNLQQTMYQILGDAVLPADRAAQFLASNRSYKSKEATTSQAFADTTVLRFEDYPKSIPDKLDGPLVYPLDKYPSVPYATTPYTILASFVMMLPLKDLLSWFEFLGLNAEHPHVETRKDCLPLVNLEGKKHGVYFEPVNRCFYINFAMIPANSFITDEFNAFCVSRLGRALPHGCVAHNGKYPVLGYDAAKSLVGLLDTYFKRVTKNPAQMLYEVGQSGKALTTWGSEEHFAPTTLCVSLDLLRDRLNHTARSIFRKDGHRHKRKSRANQHTKGHAAKLPKAFLELEYPNSHYIFKGGLRVRDDDFPDDPMMVYACFHYGVTYYNVGKFNDYNLDDFREVSPKSKADLAAMPDDDDPKYYRWKPGVKLFKDSKYQGAFYTYEFLYELMHMRNGHYANLLNIHEPKEFMSFLSGWRFSSREGFMSFWKRRNDMSRPRVDGWKKEEDEAIIKYLRPKMTEEEKIYLFDRVCKSRTRAAISVHAMHLRDKLIEEGVFDLDKIPHNRRTEKLLSKLREAENKAKQQNV
jgi:hypothetical protein